MVLGLAVCILMGLLACVNAAPNIVYIWFDDLGIGDVSFMGGDLPTPILDALVSEKSVKLNFHYSESVCSPARSAFLTGRYAFKSGLNAVIWPFSSLGFNEESNVLLSQILKDSASYNNLIAGKWHIGHDRESRLPHENGFNAGLYGVIGSEYWTPQLKRESLGRMDDNWGPEPFFSGPVQEARDALLPDDVVEMAQQYRLSTNQNGYGKATLVDVSDEAAYSEDLYVDEVKSFIAAQDDSQNPFFVYYSLYTPHEPLQQPPLERDGAAVDYSMCTDAFPSETGNCGDDLRCLYCSQIHYGSIGVQDIVASLRNNPNIDWSNTLIVITSDNGPSTPTSGEPGSAMPLRGRKAGVFEGGIRVPGFMIGGLVEQFTLDRCEYNEIVHVSDWYHIFVGLLDTVSDDYAPDADHSDLSVWDNIQCQCGGAVAQAQCNEDSQRRTELITMISCSGTTPFMHNTAIIKDGYKLIVNGAAGAGRFCPSRFRNAAGGLTKYHARPDTLYDTPNSDYYEQWYLGVRDRMDDSDLFDTVFGSACLEDLYQSDPNRTLIDDPRYPPFQYGAYLLFDLENDKVEACALNLNDPVYAAKKDALLAQLEIAALSYDAPSTDLTGQRFEYAAFQNMIENFDCEEPGFGRFRLPVAWADESQNTLDYETLWNIFVYESQKCDA